jgi:hypothetical protein
MSEAQSATRRPPIRPVGRSWANEALIGQHRSSRLGRDQQTAQVLRLREREYVDGGESKFHGTSLADCRNLAPLGFRPLLWRVPDRADGELAAAGPVYLGPRALGLPVRQSSRRGFRGAQPNGRALGAEFKRRLDREP